MRATTFFAVAAGSWGVLMSASPLLLIRTIRSRRSSAGVSLAYLAVLEVGFVLWLCYGVTIRNVAVMTTNAVASVVNLAAIATAAAFRPSDPRRMEHSGQDAP